MFHAAAVGIVFGMRRCKTFIQGKVDICQCDLMRRAGKTPADVLPDYISKILDRCMDEAEENGVSQARRFERYDVGKVEIHEATVAAMERMGALLTGHEPWRTLVDAGVVVVFAAGNDGGDGSVQNTSPTCVDPTPGVICVASYNDQDSGIQNGPMSDFSSRGLAGAVNTYPDIAAPGDGILSPCRLTLPICLTGTNGSNEYATMSGTSMAAPHIAGIVALMLQANPSLTPAQVEDILEDTARPITTGAAYQADPANPTTPTSFDKGHGLVDVFAAVAEALNR